MGDEDDDGCLYVGVADGVVFVADSEDEDDIYFTTSPEVARSLADMLRRAADEADQNKVWS